MTSSFDSYQIFAIVIICVSWLICLPLMLYFGIKFYIRSKHRIDEDNELFFDRRHPSTIYAIIIFSIFAVAIERPLIFFIYILNIFSSKPDNNGELQWFTYALGAYGVIYTFFQRAWMIFYSYKYGVAQAKLIWKQQLNPSYVETDNFYYRHIDTLGSFRSTSPCLVILWMFSVILLPILVVSIVNLTYDLGNFLLLFIPFTLLIFISFKISPINDQFYIKNELLLSIKLIGSVIAIHLLIYLLIGLTTNNVLLQVLIGSMINIIQYTLLCYIITIYVLNKNDINHVVRTSHSTSNSNSHFRDQSVESNTFSSLRSNTLKLFTSQTQSSSNNNEFIGNRKKKLFNLLKTKSGYNLFMEHLVIELSIENLLFITEYYQFKHDLSQNHLNNRISGWNILLPNGIPLSEVVSKHEGDYLSQIHLLFDKYIKWGSKFELNISARQRKKIIQQFDDKIQENNYKVDKNLMDKGWLKLSCFYDKCAVDIMKLMNDSFVRCCETKEYETWHNNLPKVNKIEEEEEEEALTGQTLNVPPT